MSIKRILDKPIPEDEKRDRKIVNTNLITHDRISLLADTFNINKTQIIHNIVQEFVRDNEKEIKEYFELKRKELDAIF